MYLENKLMVIVTTACIHKPGAVVLAFLSKVYIKKGLFKQKISSEAVK